MAQSTHSLSTPGWLITLRALAFLTCAFLLTVAVYGSGDFSSLPSSSQTLSGGVAPPKHVLQNETEAKTSNSTKTVQMWNELMDLLPEQAVENVKLIWQSGSNHQMAVASVGLLTCVTGVLMAGPVRWSTFVSSTCIIIFYCRLFFCWKSFLCYMLFSCEGWGELMLSPLFCGSWCYVCTWLSATWRQTHLIGWTRSSLAPPPCAAWSDSLLLWPHARLWVREEPEAAGQNPNSDTSLSYFWWIVSR